MTPDDDRIERLAGRLDGLFLGLAAVACGIAGLQVLRLLNGATDAAGVALPVLATALVLGARRMPAALRLNLLLVAVPTLLLVVLADVAIAVLDWRAQQAVDRRALGEVVQELRAAGAPEAVPVSRAQAYLEAPLRVDGEPVVPLSGLPHALEVLCNETGTWRSYRTDRFGFTNPDAAWDAPAELLLIGDSFAQGFCVPEGTSFADRIRAREPATLNLGGAANGPLAELGTLVEFGARARPRRVLWFFYENNDFDDVLAEAEQPLLRAYLEPGATQRLLPRLPAIHAAQRAHVEAQLDAPVEPLARRPSLRGEAIRVVRLGHLRHRFGWVRRAPHTYERVDGEAASRLVAQVVERMREESDALGARLVLVYLPGRDAVAGVGLHPLRDVVLGAAAAQGIDVIDVAASFRTRPDAARLFATRRTSSHLTPAGNAVVAEQVLEELARRGWAAAAR